MSWEVQFSNGVHLPQIAWWLDARQPVERAFVSHAHFDHLAPHREILCSEGTARLMRSRMPAERTEHVLPFGHSEQLTTDSVVTLYPAGHIFGSAQIHVAHADYGNLLYTGDFKLRPGRSAERCATPHADVLIMETTFGRPRYRFPPTEQVHADIAHFCHDAVDEGVTPVLFGYSLGKSQELLSGLASAQLPVMLHPQTWKLTRIYEELGLTFPPYLEFNDAELAGHVVICPPHSAQSPFLRRIPRRRTAVVTGWAIDPGAVFRYQCDAAFPLSDHADFADLLRFVELVQPQRVLTLHGFASDFARTLRERGIEAWAVSQDNQLEMALPLKTSAGVPPAFPPPEGRREVCDNSNPDSFGCFAAVSEQVKATPKKLEKVEFLRAYLTALPSDDAARAALFLTGRPFPQNDPRTLNLGWSVIKRALLDLTGATEADWHATYHRFSDSGDTAEAMLAGRAPPSGRAALADITAFLDTIAATRGPLRKIELLREQLRTLAAVEAKYLIKIITGDLRIGLKEGLVEEAVAAASAQPLEAVREANMLCGDIAKVMRAARTGQLDTIALRVFHPLQFMLASPEPTAGAILERLGAPVWLEEKYDGIRCQLHKQGGRVELYSRDLHRISEQFPDLVRAAARLPADFIGDGELLAWREGRALPFAELQKRLGRKGGDDFFLGTEIPVSISFYDLLWLDGRTLLKEALAERRCLLEALLSSLGPELSSAFPLSPISQAHTTDDIEAAFLRARQRGNEGLMAKDPRSPYTPGRRGLAWLKLKKAFATLDVVVVGVEYGHGKRRSVLSDYTFAVRDDATDRLLTVGKAYSGLTDAEIADLTQHFLAHTIEEHGRYRTVVPNVVLEVAFDSIQPSDRHQGGFALRFPRIARIRTDKTPSEIDTVATCRHLAEASAATPTVH